MTQPSELSAMLVLIALLFIFFTSGMLTVAIVLLVVLALHAASGHSPVSAENTGEMSKTGERRIHG